MRSFVVATSLILIAFLSTPAWAQQNRNFKVYNFTRYRITAFFFKTEDSNEWVPMRGEQIPAGESTIVTFDQSGPCRLQFRVDTTGGEADFLRPFNFCALNWIGVFYDYDTGIFTSKQGLSAHP